MKRTAFMISDGTGITAEHLGNSLMSQFKHITFVKQVLPYIDTLEKAREIAKMINATHKTSRLPPLIFITIVNLEIVELMRQTKGVVFDLFNTFIEPMEKVLKTKSSFTVGQAHGVMNTKSYTHRIEAVEFALSHDDGVKINTYAEADIILIGVSRSGKTPSCLYMALHFGIMAANYPFTEDLPNWSKLPTSLVPFKSKLFGLTIHPERLQQIRTNRSPGSKYATLEQCRREIHEIEAMYQREHIPYLDSTKLSIEEIATRILAKTGLQRVS